MLVPGRLQPWFYGDGIVILSSGAKRQSAGGFVRVLRGLASAAAMSVIACGGATGPGDGGGGNNGLVLGTFTSS